MKTQIFAMLALGFLAISPGCRKAEIDYSTLHVYQPNEVAMLIDNAVDIQKVGESIVQKTENPEDSTVTTTTTTVYRISVVVDDQGKLTPLPDSGDVSAMKQASTDPIVITTSCEMVCNMSPTGEPCHIAGCEETKRCGCSQGSCGDNCTTHKMCYQRSGAMGFGRVIIF